MSNGLKKLPIGLQTFKKLQEGNFLYIDKTKYIYDLVNSAGVYFLSRPRRFGKSLLISTLEELFQGNKELFKGLWIYNSDYDWQTYPVIRIDFSSMKPQTTEEFIKTITYRIKSIAEEYEITLSAELYFDKFKELIQKLAQINQIVILIDEYDKQIIDHIENPETAIEFREILRGFYTIIKASDQYVRFAFLTGVSKFSKMSVFSGLNNLKDITLSEQFSTMLGITQQELEEYFADYITAFAKHEDYTREQAMRLIKTWYNGYRFSPAPERVYNPFSTLLLFSENSLRNYWFETGTPTFLVKLLKEKTYNLSNIVGQTYGEQAFGSYEIDQLDPAPLFVQTGYLTIAETLRPNNEDMLYTLDFPNREVRKSFNEYLLDNYAHLSSGLTPSYVYQIRQALEKGDIDACMDVMKNFFAQIPYTINLKQEKYYQTIFYSVFLLLGIDMQVECSTNKGRIDAVVKIQEYVYIFEFELHGTAQEALEQIRTRNYASKFRGEKKQMLLVGVGFDQDERNIGEYLVEER